MEFYTSLLILLHGTYKPIDRNLKTAFVAGLMLTEDDVTLTPFVAELSYPGLSFFFTKMCEVDARDGDESLALIFAFV